jgi:vacuolar-type H+-ATPase subunit H
VPSSIRDSERTLAERDRILADARTEATRTVAEAKQQAMEIVSQQALVVTARQEADRIVAEGKRLARQRAEEADRYAVDVLRELSQRLQGILQQVNNGIDVMSTGDAAASPAAKPAAPADAAQ